MAAEYKLKFTAQEIDSKLGKISEIENSLENKQDKLAFDAEPIEGSKNPITSGGVYNALQNVGGSTDLVAGDFIEIKDGVIRSTLGDVIGTVDTFKELLRIDNLELEGEDGEYYWEDYADNVPEIGETVSIYLTLPGEETPIHYSAETIDVEGDGYSCYAFCNTDMENFGSAIDPSLPAFAVFFANYEEDGEEIKYAGVAAFGDYNGATLVVGTGGVETQYVLLPDTALGLGREIVTEVNEELVNVESIEMEEDGVFMAIITPQKLPKNDTILDVSFTPSGKLEPISFIAEVTELIIDGEFISWIASCNATFSFEDGSITAIDNTLPAFIIQMIYDDGDFDYPMMVIVSATDYTGASIVINNKVVKKTHVKLPNEALTFDEEPTEGSTNLINSGALYTAIENIASAPNFDFDSVPTENSENLLTSGNIYNSLRNFEKNLPKPQLTEGIIYSQEDRKGFSTNEKAPPTGDNAWIEGTAGYVDIGWSFTLDQSAKKITLYCNEEGYNYAEEFSNNIKSCNYLYVIFEQEPEKKYFIKTYETQVGINGYYVYFYYDFINGFDSFPTDPSYKIKNLFGLFECGSSSHAEGIKTGAAGTASHAEGSETMASGFNSHAEGYKTIAHGSASHAEGYSTIASSRDSHVQGRYNIEDNSGKYAHIVGNGTSNTARSNAHTLDWDGNAWYAGDVECLAIKCDGITITRPSLSLPTEIFSGTFQSLGTGNIIGVIIEPFKWYQVILDGIESIAISFATGDGISLSGKGFSMYKPKVQNSTNISTEAGEHNIVINELKSYDVGLINYVSSLEDRIAQLEAKLNS